MTGGAFPLSPPPKEAFAGPPALRTGPEPDVDETFGILLETPRLAVVSKSGNIPCHASGRYERNTLERVLLEKAGFPAVFFASRLDRETSGAVLVAKDAETAGALGRAMMRREVSKTYLCLARGAWREAAGPDGWCDVSGDLYPATDGEVFKFRVFVRDGTAPGPECAGGAPWTARGAPQRAETRIRRVPWEALGADPAALAGFVALECEPKTGRTHQIRATVRALGLEVAGDKLYGPDRSIYARMCEGRMTEADRAALGLGRQALHAWRISFRDPASGRPLAAEAPPRALVGALSAAVRAKHPAASGGVDIGGAFR